MTRQGVCDPLTHVGRILSDLKDQPEDRVFKRLRIDVTVVDAVLADAQLGLGVAVLPLLLADPTGEGTRQPPAVLLSLQDARQDVLARLVLVGRTLGARRIDATAVSLDMSLSDHRQCLIPQPLGQKIRHLRQIGPDPFFGWPKPHRRAAARREVMGGDIHPLGLGLAALVEDALTLNAAQRDAAVDRVLIDGFDLPLGPFAPLGREDAPLVKFDRDPSAAPSLVVMKTEHHPDRISRLGRSGDDERLLLLLLAKPGLIPEPLKDALPLNIQFQLGSVGQRTNAVLRHALGAAIEPIAAKRRTADGQGSVLTDGK